MSPYITALRNIKESTERIQLILTVRGLLVVIFLALMLSGPVIHESDIVAAVLSWCGLALVCVLALAVTAKGLQLRRDLNLSLGIPKPKDGSKISSDDLVRIFIRSTPITVPPLCCLNLTLHFAEGELRTATHQITGHWGESDLVHEDLLFPHRGEWQVDRIELTFGDQLGLCKLSWTFEDQGELGLVTVNPPPGFNRALPILSSSSSSGDLADDVQEPLGDPYDLKPYHPSDGVKKILWKLYAKSGELVSRHAERTMTPEGQVVIFCMADEKEDKVVSRTLAYIQSLRELNLEVYVGCLGQAHEDIAKNQTQAEELLTSAVWSSRQADPIADMRSIVGKAQNYLSGRRLDRLLIFLSRARIADDAEADQTIALLNSLKQGGVQPVLFVVTRGRLSIDRKSHEGSLSRILGLFYQAEVTPQFDDKQPDQKLLAACSANSIDVIMVD